MAETTKKIKPGLLILGLAITAVTLGVGAWAISKGWSIGKK